MGGGRSVEALPSRRAEATCGCQCVAAGQKCFLAARQRLCARSAARGRSRRRRAASERVAARGCRVRGIRPLRSPRMRDCFNLLISADDDRAPVPRRVIFPARARVAPAPWGAGRVLHDEAPVVSCHGADGSDQDGWTCGAARAAERRSSPFNFDGARARIQRGGRRSPLVPITIRGRPVLGGPAL